MVRIRFESIKIDSLSKSSSVNSGINVVIGRSSREEINEGMGAIDGKHNEVSGGMHTIAPGRPSGRSET
ncbi:hypothetical protein FE783_04315 [Paenibacillus mesophilus]|uniref:hypothetical protein n=1 Tax=Paenibacillus mesophilus TaxID=2582849 RepID=UPI00110D4640|nr:hypothetical protein [Paenibacillus mesophilus]TMV52174.1 hypothetical protein FE783_04315 [Paenibacillus mesophilus]